MKEDIREVVREKYAAAIKNTKAGFSGGCCSTTQGRISKETGRVVRPKTA